MYVRLCFPGTECSPDRSWLNHMPTRFSKIEGHRKIETHKVQVDMTVKYSEMLHYADITVYKV